MDNSKIITKQHVNFKGDEERMEVVRSLKNKKKKVILYSVSFIILISAAIVYYKLNYYNGKKVVERLNYNWGMGIRVTETVSNNKDYEWYVDQLNTGKYGKQNCGPASCEMAIKWVDKDSKITAEEIRDKYIAKNGEEPAHSGMNGLEVKDTLEGNNVKYKLILPDDKFIDSESEVLDELKSGNILMLSLAMRYISKQERGWYRNGREWSGNYYHWVIIKGYKIVEGKTYLEIYDPWRYKGEGKDRYFLLSEVSEAFTGGFIIEKK